MATFAASVADSKLTPPPSNTAAASSPLPAAADTTRKLWEQIQTSIPKLQTLRTIEGVQEIEEGVYLLECAIRCLQTRQMQSKTEEERLNAFGETQGMFSSIHIAQNALATNTRSDEVAKANVRDAEGALAAALKASRLVQGDAEVKPLLDTFDQKPHLLISPWLCRRYEELFADKEKLSLEEKDTKLKAYRAFWSIIAEAVKSEREVMREEMAFKMFVCHFIAINEREGAVDMIAGKFHPVGILHNLLVETRALAQEVKKLATPTQDEVAPLKARAAQIVETYQTQAATLKILCEQSQALDTTHFYTSTGIHFPAHAGQAAIHMDALDPTKLKAAHKKIWDPLREKARSWRTQLETEFNECRLLLRQKEADVEIEELTRLFKLQISALKTEEGKPVDQAETLRLRAVLDECIRLYHLLDKKEAYKTWLDKELTQDYIILTPPGSALRSQLSGIHAQILKKYEARRTALKTECQSEVIAFWRKLIHLRFSELATRINAQIDTLNQLFAQKLPEAVTACIAAQHAAVASCTVDKVLLSKILIGPENHGASRELQPFKTRFVPIAQARLELEALLTTFDAMPAEVCDTLFNSNLKMVWTEESKGYEAVKALWLNDKKWFDDTIWTMAENLNRLEYVSTHGVLPWFKAVHNAVQLHQGTAYTVGYSTTYTSLYYGAEPAKAESSKTT